MTVGSVVTFAYPDNGYESDRIVAAQNLRLNWSYTVASVDQHAWVTYVTLVEIPGVRFNSVLFA